MDDHDDQRTADLELQALAGGIAHRFNNMLASILGNASLALAQIPTDTDAHRAVLRVVASAEAAARLTNQMLACSGGGRFVVEPLDLSAIVDELADRIQVAVAPGVRIERHTEPDLPLVCADAAQMRLLVMNLVFNAADALVDGSGNLTITTRSRAIDQAPTGALPAGPLEPGRYVELTVADTGCGMDRHVLQRIFDPFFSTRPWGHGLGLTAILGIVRAQQGAVQVTSDPGQGTSVRVLLPAVEEDSCACAAPDDRAEDRDRPTCVLVVDDEEAIREFLQAALELHGFRVLTASDGDIAIERYEAEPDAIDIVLLDMTMPRVGGVEAFRALRDIRADVRIVLTSGYNHLEATRPFTRDGRARFIQKPYRLARLLQTIQALLPEPRTGPHQAPAPSG